MVRRLLLASTASLLLAVAAFAADVKVTGLHNCCGACKKALDDVMTKSAATNVNISSTEISFSTTDPDKTVKALFDAGFAGKVEGAKTPEAQGAKGVKAKTLKLEGIHNCCGGCTRAVDAALKPFGTHDLKPRATACTLTSETELDAEKVVEALRKAGYNARVAK